MQNIKIREILKLDKLHDEKDSIIRWFGHVKRMTTGRIQALEYRLRGKRPRGLLRYRWEEQIEKNVVKRGIKWMEMMEEETWNDRDSWRLLSKTRPLTIET